MSFVSSRDCLSVTELLELKETGDETATAHVAGCHRCRALLKSLKDVDGDTVRPIGGGKTRSIARPMRQPIAAAEKQPGTIWIAAGDESGWMEVVLVIGRSRRDRRVVVVVPISDAVEDGTDLDIRLPDEALGYPAQAAVWNFGWLYDRQLVRPIAEVAGTLRREITGLYGWLVGAVSERPEAPHAVGPALGGDDDRRQLRREQEHEQLQTLWRAVNRDQEPTEEQRAENIVAAAAEATIEVAPTKPSFGQLLSEALAGEEWDAVTLAEAIGAERSTIDKIAADQLDLTHFSDAPTVVSIVRQLVLDLNDLHEPILLSLSRSPGGQPRFDHTPERLAARAKPGASEADVQRDLFGQSVDQSVEARAKQAERYWHRLLELDDTPDD